MKAISFKSYHKCPPPPPPPPLYPNCVHMRESTALWCMYPLPIPQLCSHEGVYCFMVHVPPVSTPLYPNCVHTRESTALWCMYPQFLHPFTPTVFTRGGLLLYGAHAPSSYTPLPQLCSHEGVYCFMVHVPPVPTPLYPNCVHMRESTALWCMCPQLIPTPLYPNCVHMRESTALWCMCYTYVMGVDIPC